MATRKITITLDQEQCDQIQALVTAGAASSTSGFVQHAVRQALFDAAGWNEMLTGALQKSGGPMTAAERDWADAVLSGKISKPRPRKHKAA